MSSRWPFPREDSTERARRVARTYREALYRVEPQACGVIDDAARSAGERWVLPYLGSADDWVAVRDAAALIGRSTRWVYLWAHAHPDGARKVGKRIRVRVGDILQSR